MDAACAGLTVDGQDGRWLRHHRSPGTWRDRQSTGQGLDGGGLGTEFAGAGQVGTGLFQAALQQAEIGQIDGGRIEIRLGLES